MIHPDGHAEVLQRVLLGELPETDAAVSRQLANCAECRAELARLRALDERLVITASREREDLVRARATTDEADAQLVRATLVQALAARRRSRARRSLAFALAAGLLLAVAVGVRLLLDGGAEPAPEFLLGGKIPCTAPVGAGASYEEFRWDSEHPPRTRFEIRVFAAVDGKKSARLDTIDGLQETRWRPTPDQQSGWPSPMIWEVLLIDETTGDVRASGEAWTQR